MSNYDFYEDTVKPAKLTQEEQNAIAQLAELGWRHSYTEDNGLFWFRCPDGNLRMVKAESFQQAMEKLYADITYKKPEPPKLEEKPSGAIRHDDGKPDYTHIHPAVWSKMMVTAGIYTGQALVMSDDMDRWFYNDAVGLYVGVEHVRLAVPVLDWGYKTKYAFMNYAKGMAASRVMKSFRRHCMAIIEEGMGAVDAESGMLHLGHMASNYIFAATYMLTKPAGFIDDRVPLENE